MQLNEFREYAKNYNVIPVTRKLLADGETPIGVYRKLAKLKPNTFLLESAEHGGVWSRYSFIGVASEATLTEKDGKVFWRGTVPAGAPVDVDPLKALRMSAEHLRSPQLPGMPTLTGGLVGYMGYDSVRRLEKLPSIAINDLNIPELEFMLTSDLAVMDHAEGTITLIANVINWDGSDERVDEVYELAIKRLDRMQNDLQAALSGNLAFVDEKSAPQVERNISENDFLEKVSKVKEEIKAGEAFQVVISQRFAAECKADSIDVYRMLRLHNPSPYMFFLRFEDGLDVVGSSPEALVKVTNGEVMVHPIAGTRKRSSSPELDEKNAKELLADPKERAEHLMLVDLGRNDLGRVCESGSVEVVEFMNIERFSHVMHIVSTVTGKLSKDKAPIDALFSTFPAGTLSGAPKPRAMEIIEELEPNRRGLYGGALGYLDFRGNIDTCIAIRTAVIKDGKAYVQAGAGVVADSDANSENQECINKAAAVLGAVNAANNLRVAK
jgi:anthranilate synthase component 1